MLLIFYLLEREYSPVISFSMALQMLCQSKIKTMASFGFIPDSKDSEIEEEDELPEGDRVDRYGRRVGSGRLRYSS